MLRSAARLGTALLAAALCSPGGAQQLRRGMEDATSIVVARPVGVQPLGNEFFLHRFETLEQLWGEPLERFTIVARKRVADVPAPPSPPVVRLFCLVPDTTLELPARHAPYARPTGYHGDAPAVTDDPASRTTLRFARALAAARAGAEPGETTAELLDVVAHGTGSARVEAVEVLRESPELRAQLAPPALDALLQRAAGETDDVPLKVALASLCAEAGVEGTVPVLCASLAEVSDPRFAKALGRIARHLHGEDAAEALEPALGSPGDPARAAALLALGATRTAAALDRLLELRRSTPEDVPAVDAALRAHGSRRARAALSEKDSPEEPPAPRRSR